MHLFWLQMFLIFVCFGFFIQFWTLYKLSLTFCYPNTLWYFETIKDCKFGLNFTINMFLCSGCIAGSPNYNESCVYEESFKNNFLICRFSVKWRKNEREKLLCTQCPFSIGDVKEVPMNLIGRGSITELEVSHSWMKLNNHFKKIII